LTIRERLANSPPRGLGAPGNPPEGLGEGKEHGASGSAGHPSTRRAYARAVDEFLAWCEAAGVPSIGAVQPVHVTTWIEAGTRELAAPSVKQRLAAFRHLFDWLVTGQVVPVNPHLFSLRFPELSRSRSTAGCQY
jgi:hypothetical protein